MDTKTRSKKSIAAQPQLRVTDAPTEGGGAAQIQAWEDDPLSAVLMALPPPNPQAGPLAFSFPQPAPPPISYATTSAEFRYWNAVDALRRGADFWASRVPSGQWQLGQVLPVLLDEGEDLNAYYDRQALHFFHGMGPTGVVYSGESPDILCHEMGHAILDAIKPELFDTMSHETAAFHESFGDMSAILSALQLPSLRSAVLKDTYGHFYSASRLSRLAEQLGSAIRARWPDSVDPDCLRNAVNTFSYRDPAGLPSQAPASHLSSEPHSFSRVFTGAFYECLSGMLQTIAADAHAPTEQELQQASAEMADILVGGVTAAAVVPNYLAQVACGMIDSSAQQHPAYPAMLRQIFVRRAILSMQPTGPASPTMGIAGSTRNVRSDLPHIALAAHHYGLGARPLLVQSAGDPPRYTAAGADPEYGAVQTRSADNSARAYVEDLFQRGRVSYGTVNVEAPISSRTLKSHTLIERNDGVYLKRVLFDCGFGGA